MSKKCRCNIISFGHTNIYLLLILLGASLKAVKEKVISLSDKLSKGKATETYKQHPVIITINYSMGLCITFILFIIYKIYNKHKNKKILSSEKMMNSQNKKISLKEKFLWILLGAPFDFFANLIYSYNWIKEEDYLCYWPSNMLLMTLFSYLILKMKLFKHHYLSIIIITIFGIFHNFIAGHFNKKKFIENFRGYLIYFLAESIFNILYVLYKFFMIKKSIKSYGILSFQGLIELILGIIILAITTIHYPKLDDFNRFIEKIEPKEIAIFCSLILINFLTFLTIFIIIDIFTPFHIFLLNILSEIITGFIIGTYSSETYKAILYCIFIIICIFMVLVFIEIINLNFCGLSTMTKKNIEERAKHDTILLDKDGNVDNASNIKDIGVQDINCGEYSFELKDFNNDESSQILP